MGEFLPVVHAQQGAIPDLGDEQLLDCLKTIDGGLVPGGPLLAAIIQPGLNQTSQQSEHETPTSPPEGTQSPACHATA